VKKSGLHGTFPILTFAGLNLPQLAKLLPTVQLVQIDITILDE
jgi:hypothetical protein